MTLVDLGWNSDHQNALAELKRRDWIPGRVAVEDKHAYLIYGEPGELTARVSGKLLHQTSDPSDLPKVGDWVALQPLEKEAKGVIHHVLPRRTRLSRKMAGRDLSEQVLAANVDFVCLVQALDGTFNPRLLERQLVMVRESGAQPVVVLNKADLHDHVAERFHDAQQAAGSAPVAVVSAKTGQDLECLSDFVRPGVTIVLIGPSGVGKSSLINRLYGEEILGTTEVRESDSKGRHTTSWRQLILLPGGGMVIDTPGMREFHLWMAGLGVQGTFAEIEDLAAGCRFRDCTHTHEKECAVKAALGHGTLPKERYQSYLKLQRELDFLDQAQHHRVILDRKRRAKTAQRAFNKVKRR